MVEPLSKVTNQVDQVDQADRAKTANQKGLEFGIFTTDWESSRLLQSRQAPDSNPFRIFSILSFKVLGSRLCSNNAYTYTESCVYVKWSQH